MIRTKKLLVISLTLFLALGVIAARLDLKVGLVHAPAANGIFGKTSIGGTLANVQVGYAFADRLQAPEDGMVTMISAYLKGRFTSGLVKAMIYSDVDGEAGSLLAENETALLADWAWHNFTVNRILRGGEYYWFGIFGSVHLQTMFDLGAAGQHAYAWGWTYPTVPSEFGGIYGPTYVGEETSIYVTYTALESRVISGSVTDDSTGLPLADVEVTADGVGSVYTIADGTYTLEVVAGVYTVTFSKAGYVTSDIPVDATAGNVSGVDVALSPLLVPYTFGKTGVGGSIATVCVGYAFAGRLQAPEDGTATSISAYIRGRYSSGLVKAMIYSDVGGGVGSLLLESEIGLLSSWAWHSFSVSYGLRGGEYYWFGIFASVELQATVDPGLSGQHAYAWGWAYPTVPTEFGGIYGPAYASEADSIYVTYTPAEVRYVSGTVTDNATVLPLVDVEVRADGYGPVYTLADGTYTIQVAVGVYTVEFSKDGYESAYTSVDTTAGDVSGVDVALSSPEFQYTFGKTSVGGEMGTVPYGYVFACRFQAPEDGTATMISAYIRGRYSSGLVKAMIYSDVGGEAGSLLAENETALLTDWAWHTFTVNYGLEGGEYYWFGVFGSVELQATHNLGLPGQHAYAWGWAYPTVPTEFGGNYGPAYSSDEDSIYVTYTPAEVRYVSGTVTDDTTGLPLADVEVTTDGYGPVYTLADGTYTIQVIVGTYTLTFSKAGYESAYTIVDTTAGDVSGADVAMSPLPRSFGKTSVGGTVATVPLTYAFAARLQAPEDGTATSISAYIRGRYTSGLVKAMIYSDVGGGVGSLLFESEIALSADWAWHTFTVDYSLDGGEYYWFGIFASVELQATVDPGLPGQHAYAWGWAYPTVPTEFGGIYGPAYASEEDSIYVTYTPVAGYALDFDGTNDYVEVPDDSSLRGMSELSIDLWYYPRSGPNTNDVILSKWMNYYIRQENGWGDYRYLRFFIWGPDDSVVSDYTLGEWHENQWNHIVCTWDCDVARIYLNNVKVGEKDMTNRDVSDFSGFNLTFADYYRTNGAVIPLNGSIDEVKIYERAINETEISYSYNNGNGRYSPLNSTGLVGHWHLDEGDGTTVGDETSYGNDGTVYGDGDEWITGVVQKPT